MYDEYQESLEGDMSIPSAKRNTTEPGAPDFNTLDEPIKETIVSFESFLTIIIRMILFFRILVYS